MSLDWIAPQGRSREEEVDEAARAPREALVPPSDGNGRAARSALRRVVPRLAPPQGPEAGKDQWVPLGPHVTLGGQATRHPRISGRCRAIAVSNDGRRVYAGTAQGGTWFSSDGGEHWTPLDFYATTKDLDDELGEANALAVGAIAVRFRGPEDGSQDEVYVGTGEMRFVKYAPLPLHMQGVGVRVAVGPGQKVATGGVATDPWTLEATELAGAAVLRLVVDDTTGEVWAATTRGLLHRPAGAALGASWEEVDCGLDPATLTDVVLTRGEGAGPRRVWVASSRPRLAFRPLTSSGAFTPVHLPVFPLPESVKVVPVTMVALAEGNIPGQAVVYVLADGPRLWRVHDAKAEVVEGLPDELFGDQATYDMAIAVHPVAPDWIAVGGMGIDTGPGMEQYDAALFSQQVVKQTDRPGWRFTGGAKPETGQPPSFVGTGVHADVHDLAWVPGPTGSASQLWVACDGGVFASRDGGAEGTFAPRNTGLGTIEAQYLAQHPTNDAVLLVGTQDNGTVRALGPETWQVARPGDGGGVAIDPRDGRRQLAQYLHTVWSRSLDGGLTFEDVTLLGEAPTVLDVGRWEGAAREEHDAAAPYATATAIAAGPVTQLAVGTDRVWLSTDWGVNWATLPSGKDPYDQFEVANAPDRTLDVLDDRGRIFALKWASPDALHVLTKDGVYLYSRSSVPGSPWTRVRRYDRPQVLRDTKRKTPGDKTPSGQIPAHLELTDLASHDLHRAGLGSLYVATSGAGAEHVWWFDGTGRWLRAGLPVDSPVHAIVVDPAHPEVVYAGTDVGVWKGVGTFPPPGDDDPAWAWTHFSSALPEAACIDLVLHEQARLLRAALRGRGVWEVALDGVVQARAAYVRAHAFDTRRRPLPASGPGARDPLGDPASTAPLRLDASPDLRAYRAVGAPPPPFSTGDWTPFELWVLQSAMRAGGLRVEPTGVLDGPTQAVGSLPATPEEWETWVGGVMANRLPFDHDPPDAADVTVTLRDEPDHRAVPTCSCSAGAAGARVWAVVHGREARPLAPARVAVFVLRATFAGATDLAGLPRLPGAWAAKLRDDLSAGTPGGWFGTSGWAYLDAQKPFRRPARPVDPREAQVVQFDVPAAAWPAGDWLLLTVVLADDDPLDQAEAAETDVGALVRQSRHVAARSVRRGAP